MKKLAVLITLTTLLLGFSTISQAWEVTFCDDNSYYSYHSRYNRCDSYRCYTTATPVVYHRYYTPAYRYHPTYSTVSFRSPYAPTYDRYTVRETVYLY